MAPILSRGKEGYSTFLERRMASRRNLLSGKRSWKIPLFKLHLKSNSMKMKTMTFANPNWIAVIDNWSVYTLRVHAYTRVRYIDNDTMSYAARESFRTRFSNSPRSLRVAVRRGVRLIRVANRARVRELIQFSIILSTIIERFTAADLTQVPSK